MVCEEFYIFFGRLIYIQMPALLIDIYIWANRDGLELLKKGWNVLNLWSQRIFFWNMAVGVGGNISEELWPLHIISFSLSLRVFAIIFHEIHFSGKSENFLLVSKEGRGRGEIKSANWANWDCSVNLSNTIQRKWTEQQGFHQTFQNKICRIDIKRFTKEIGILEAYLYQDIKPKPDLRFLKGTEVRALS